jgi:hypothetical protein
LVRFAELVRFARFLDFESRDANLPSICRGSGDKAVGSPYFFFVHRDCSFAHEAFADDALNIKNMHEC